MHKCSYYENSHLSMVRSVWFQRFVNGSTLSAKVTNNRKGCEKWNHRRNWLTLVLQIKFFLSEISCTTVVCLRSRIRQFIIVKHLLRTASEAHSSTINCETNSSRKNAIASTEGECQSYGQHRKCAERERSSEESWPETNRWGKCTANHASKSAAGPLAFHATFSLSRL